MTVEREPPDGEAHDLVEPARERGASQAVAVRADGARVEPRAAARWLPGTDRILAAIRRSLSY